MPDVNNSFEVDNDGLQFESGSHVSSSVGAPTHVAPQGSKYYQSNGAEWIQYDAGTVNTGWRINTATALSDTLYVAKQNAPFTTIQSAIDYAELDNTRAYNIKIAPGQYTEDLTISEAGISLEGDRTGLTLAVFIQGKVVINHSGNGGHSFTNLAVLAIGGITFDFQSMFTNSFVNFTYCFAISTGAACVKVNHGSIQLRVNDCFMQCTGAGGATFDLTNYIQAFFRDTIIQNISNSGCRITSLSGQDPRFTNCIFLSGGGTTGIMLDLQNNKGATLKGCTLTGPGDGIVMAGAPGNGSVFLEEMEVFLPSPSPGNHWVSGVGNCFTAGCTQLGVNFDIDVTNGIVHTAINTVPVIV